MNKLVWHTIFKKYLQNYYAISGLASANIIDEEEKHRLFEKLLNDIMTTFDSEVNE